MEKNPKNFLKEKNIKPMKKFGQNFLMSKSILEKIIKSAELDKNDIVIEIGPGTGVLTKELASRVKKIIAVEKDRELFRILKEELTAQKINNIELINQDVLNFQFSIINFQSNSKLQISNKKYKVVANLPYYVASPAIRMFLESENPPELMVVMVQKEVGRRICAKPPEMSKIAVFSQFYAEPSFVAKVPKELFWPKPKVDGAVIKLKVKNPALSWRSSPNEVERQKSKVNIELFSKIVNAGFSHPRKQLLNNLSKELKISRQQAEKWLEQNNISPIKRAEALSVENWIKLAKTFPYNNPVCV